MFLTGLGDYDIRTISREKMYEVMKAYPKKGYGFNPSDPPDFVNPDYINCELSGDQPHYILMEIENTQGRMPLGYAIFNDPNYGEPTLVYDVVYLQDDKEAEHMVIEKLMDYIQEITGHFGGTGLLVTVISDEEAAKIEKAYSKIVGKHSLNY